MKLFKKLLTGILCCALPALLFSQDFSNKGKDFWVIYTGHVDGTNSRMALYITSDQNASGTVSVNGNVIPFNVTANQVTTVRFTSSSSPNNSVAYNGQTVGIGTNKGIHIVSDKPVVVYSHILNAARSGSTLVLPTNVLGREYYVASYASVNAATGVRRSEFAVVATQNNTTIEITPRQTDANNTYPANVPFQITLNTGDVFQYQTANDGDLTGTYIKSIATATSPCKPIAVFSGSTWTAMGCANGGSGDNLYQQLFPFVSWGQYYITAPFKDRSFDIFRILVQDPATMVTVNGVPLNPATLINGRYYEFNTAGNNTPRIITSTQPICVMQYMITQNCDNIQSDPEMIMLNSVEQTLNDITVLSARADLTPPNTNITRHFLNIVVKTSALGSLTIDGSPYTSTPVAIPTTQYSYLQEEITASTSINPSHRIKCDSGFLAIAYGYGNVESYGYNAGANVRDLYQFISIQNQYATVNFPATCKNAPFYFRSVFPFEPSQIQWVFGPTLNAMGIADVTINPTPGSYDSTWVINGKTLYRYTLPTPQTITTAGTYPIKIIANNPTPDGCSGIQEIDYDLQVFNPPSAGFYFNTNGCVTAPVSFFDTSNTAGRAIIQWNWNFGDAGTSGIQNPTHSYPAPGSYFATLSVITDVGCISDTATRTINLALSPQAKFGASLPYCVGKSITFTDSSIAGAGSVLAKWYWNFGDGSPQIIATSNAPQIHTYTGAGTYNATLKVETTTGCQSFVFTKTIVIYSNPTASFSINGNVCLPSGTASFVNASTMPDGSGPLMTYLWNFGDGNTSTATNPVYNYTTGGPFTVTLTATSNNGCVDDTVRIISNIYAQPDAAFTVDSVESCFGGTFNFTDQSTAANSTVTQWFWDFGDATTSTMQNPTKQYAATGTYTVKLYINSGAGCRSDTATMNVTVLQLPTAGFTNSNPVCERVPIQFTSTSVANAGTITQYNWTINGNPVGGNNSVITYTPATAGTYNIALTVVTDKGCTKQTTGTLNVNPSPVASFNLPNVCLPAGNASFTSTSTVTGGTITNYLWNFGNSQTATTPTASTTYSSTGPFNVTLTVTSSNGCIDDTVRVLNTVFAQPQAAFNAPAEVCLGAPVNFTDQSTAPNSTVTQWLWNFGDATTSTQQNPTKNYSAPGTYTVTLIITSAIGCVSTVATRTVVVNALPTANFTTSTPACATREITFTDASAANSGTLVKWTWNFGDGNNAVLNTPSPFIHNYTNPGTYNVTLQVETNKGCISTMLTTPITINVLPEAGYIAPEVCLTDPYAPFIDTSKISTGTVTGWLWNFGDPNANAGNPNTSTLQNPTHRYTVVGSYTATLIAISNNGCRDTISKTFTVNGSIPLANFTVQNANALCSNKDVTISDISTVDFGSLVKTEIYWDWANDPTIKTTDDFPLPGKLYTHIYPEFGVPATKTYTIRMVSYSGLTCMNVLIKTITVLATPTLRFDPVGEICTNAPSFQITQASMTNGLPGTGVFTGPGVSSTGMFNPVTAGVGTHTLRYTFTGANSCSNFIEQTIAVNPTPAAFAGPDKFVLEGGQVQLTPALNAGFPVTYSWTPPTGLSNPNAPDPIASPVDDITYTMRVISDKGCTTSDQVFVKVLKKPAIPNIFSPNGDGIHDKWVISALDTYPGCTVEIFNRYGQRIFYSIGYTTPWDGSINGKPVPVGTYYYIVDPKNGRQKIAGYVDIVR